MLQCHIATLFFSNTMSSQRDLERATTPDERAPLLAHDATRQQRATPSESGDDLDAPDKATSNTWYYVWRALLALFAILIIAVFIKAWIDADDVEVSTPQMSNYRPRQLIVCDSLISKVH